MGLVVKDDSWRIPEWLWEQIDSGKALVLADGCRWS
jgi:hypothetical protein